MAIAVVLQLAAAHAPQVAPETIAAVAQAESRLNPYAIYDNTDRRGYDLTTPAEATALARRLLDRGHSIDAGLMQINSANFSRTGLSTETAFDPASSIRAGGQILVDAYQWCQQRQAADPLKCAISVYNTGKPTAGERNGYVGRVWKAADHIVPAIRQAVPDPPSQPPAHQQTPPPTVCGLPPPNWDGRAVTSYQNCVIRFQLTHQEGPQDELE